MDSVHNVLTILVQMVMVSAPRAQPDAQRAVVAVVLKHAPSASPGTAKLLLISV